MTTATTPTHTLTRPAMFYPSFQNIDTEDLYSFSGEGLPLTAGTPVTVIAQRKLVGQPNLVYHTETNTYAAVSELHLVDYLPEAESCTVELHYLNIAKLYEEKPHAAYLATDEDKTQALSALGITRQEGQSHLLAWILAMARLNGLPEELPQYTIGEAAFIDRAIAKFVWFLA